MPDIAESASSRLSGRPQSIDPESVARIALELFAKHGYDMVSMAQIAESAGIGRKSLYRYFSSKADLVWGGLIEASTISDAAMEAAREAGNDALRSLLAGMLAAYDSLPDPEVTRGRLLLIAEQPELLAQASARMAPDSTRVVRLLESDGVQAESAQYLALAFGTVTFAAWVRWAQSTEQSPAAYMARAIEVLRLP